MKNPTISTYIKWIIKKLVIITIPVLTVIFLYIILSALLFDDAFDNNIVISLWHIIIIWASVVVILPGTEAITDYFIKFKNIKKKHSDYVFIWERRFDYFVLTIPFLFIRAIFDTALAFSAMMLLLFLFNLILNAFGYNILNINLNFSEYIENEDINTIIAYMAISISTVKMIVHGKKKRKKIDELLEEKFNKYEKK